MKVQTTTEAAQLQSLKVAQVRPEFNAALAQLIGDPTHNLAWPMDMSHLIPIKPTGTHPVAPGVVLQTANLSDMEEAAVKGKAGEKRRKIVDRSLAVIAASNALVKYGLPQHKGMADGVECFVATSQTILALTDPKRTSVVPVTFKAARAIVSALEMLKSSLPSVISANLPEAGLLV